MEKIQLRRSLASVVVTAAHNLTATPAADSDVSRKRAVGRCLLECEVLGMRVVDEDQRKPYTQGLALRLGFYDDATAECFDPNGAVGRAEAEANLGVAEEAIGWALGGYWGAVQLEPLERLEGAGWRSALYAEIPRTPRVRLDRLLPDLADEGSDGISPGKRRIILRRLRYRGAVDHAQSPGSAADIIYWTTPTTLSWIQQSGYEHPLHHGNRIAGPVNEVLGKYSSDMSTGDPDDWGAVDLEGDPLRVLEVTTKSGVTRAETSHAFDRAGVMLEVTTKHTAKSDRHRPLEVFIEKAQSLVDDPDLEDHVDVVLFHRGGGLHPEEDADANIPNDRRRAFLDQCDRITERGVEVVVGLGHGNVSALRAKDDQTPLPVGVYEATTPTAAAEWIVREHINRRLVDAEADPGQASL